MRWSLALVPLLMLSGCLSGDEPAGGNPGDSGDGGRGSDPGPFVDPAPRKGVVFFSEPYQAGPGQPAEFAVQVPEGARNVRLEVAVNVAAQGMQADVELSGCGAATVEWSTTAGVAADGNWKDADLCPSAAAGPQPLVVAAPALPLAGRVLLRADLPDA